MAALSARQLRQAVRHAVLRASLASSVHHSQPWRFAAGETSLEVFADWSRWLPALDPRGRQLLMSCGCAVLNARASLQAAGLAVTVHRSPDAAQPELLARLTVGTDDGSGTPLGGLDEVVAPAVPREGRSGVLPPGLLYGVLAAARQEGATLVAVLRAKDRATLARLIRQGELAVRTDPAARAELLAYGGTASAYHGRVGDTVLLLGTEHASIAGCVRAGEALQRTLLTLTRAGYAASWSSRPAEPASRAAELRAALGLASEPLAVLRVEPTALTAAPRRRRLVDMLQASG